MSTLIRWIKRLESREAPKTVVATAATTITHEDAIRGVVVSNLGASAQVTFTLPAAVVGMRVAGIIETDAQELRFNPDGTETIALPSTGVQGAAGKYLTANAITESIELVCLTAGTWTATRYSGTWTAEA